MIKKDVFFPAILHGGDYNPEQWPEAVWDDDVRLMQEAHCNVATVPVFGWVSLQPDEDTWTFDWLDRVLDKLHAGGISACLATATASVPAWVDQKYPDILQVGPDGCRKKHGGRHVFCPNSKNFRRLSTDLTRRLAERYRNHPALLVWHVSNEYGNYCYCDQCADAFREWLKARYGSLEELNARWTAKFWGHTYTDWQQIETPTANGERSMQGLLIDYNRFQSDSILSCYKAEAAVLREVTPQIPITTNLMGAFKPLDYHKWAAEMDIVSWDNYPPRGADPAGIAFHHDLMRGLKQGQPFMLMEQTPSQQNWQAYNALKRPGIMRLWSYQAMAHGADTVMYFQWRRSQGAQEKYHGAVVEHVGTSAPRVFQEVAQLGKELEKLGAQTLGGRVPAKAALLFDWDNWWALEFSSGPSVDLKYVAQVQAWHKALFTLGIPLEIVSPDADLSNYSVVIAPVLYMVKPGFADKLTAFTEAGGTFIATYFSGIVDENDRVYLGGYPGPLRKLLGIWAEEIDVLSPQEQNSIFFAQPFGTLQGTYPARMLCDLIHLEGAKALAHYGEDFYAGRPALTVHSYGAGKAYYLATALDAPALTELIAHICAEQDISPPLPDRPEAGIEVTVRVSPAGEELLYLLNHSAAPVTQRLPSGAYMDLLSETRYSEYAEIPAHGVLILVPKA
jgi:beta-galactosidase